MATAVKIGFEPDVAMLATSALLPLRLVPPAVKQTAKYRRIANSVTQVGLIEPLVVARAADVAGHYLLLDGHLRLAVLEDIGATEVKCLISTDDEAFTYNKRISRLATIQEHYMVVRAIERGVPEDRLARALNLDVKAVRRRRMMLNGICPEVVDLLKDKSVNPAAFDALRKMKASRQLEAAELMTVAANYSAVYAKALLAATRPRDLTNPTKGKIIAGLAPEQIARMEREMETLQQDVKSIEADYGDDALVLVVAAGYFAKLMANVEIRAYLSAHHSELLPELRTTIEATTLHDPSFASASFSEKD
jgi:ParB-like chromosome segregation protein Spo0J